MHKIRDLSVEENIEDIKSCPQYCTDEKYIEWMAKTTPWRGRRAIKILQDYFRKNAKILDVGHSHGLTISYTAQVFTNIQGVDIDQKVTKIAKERLRKLKLKTRLTLYNGKRLPFKDNSFDGVVSTEVFEHVGSPKNFIKEIHRVLKPKGILIISAPNKLYPIECEFHLPFLSYLPKKLADLYVQASGKGVSYNNINHPTYWKFRKTIEKYFEIEDITFSIIKNYKKYYLKAERGSITVIAAFIIKSVDMIKNTPFRFLYSILKIIISNLSAGWIFVCTKRSVKV